MIKAIIFDCFGVVKRDGLDEAYAAMGGDPDADRQFIIDTITKVNKGLVPSSVPIFAAKLGVSEEAWWQTIQSFNSVDMELLAYVKELRSQYKSAMLSNISSHGLERAFEPGFLDTYFDISVGSGDIGFAKPEARAYQIVADGLGVRAEECVMIDDRQEYCDGAVHAGMQAILFIDLPALQSELQKVLQR